MSDLPFHDPVWCQNRLKILVGRRNDPQIVPLRYKHAQRRLNAVVRQEEVAGRPVRLVCLKMRQEAGVSTWTESLIYRRCRLFPNQQAAIISHDPDGTNNLYQMFRRFHEHDPGAPSPKHMHQKGLAFAAPHNSQVVVQTAAKRFASSGSTIQMLHASEFAKWPFPVETMLSVMYALSNAPNTFAMIESTAYGAGGAFHERWQEAEVDYRKMKSGQWRGVFIPWHEGEECRMDPATVDMSGLGTEERYNFYAGEELDLLKQFSLTHEHLAWRRWNIDNKCGGDVLLYHQENPSTAEESFIAGGTPRFALNVLRQWYRETVEPEFVGVTPLILEGRSATLDLRPEAGGWLRIWTKPQPGHRYVIGADCAGSDAGGDYNAACVLDKSLTPWTVVATLHGLRGADLYARALANVGYLFNEAHIAVEVNGIGEACQSHLRHWYPERSIYHRLPIDRAKRRPGERIGWYTGHVTRHNLIEGLDATIRDQTIAVPDEDTLLELLNFQRVAGARNGEAKPGMHDDRVFALGIAIQAAGYKVSGEYDHFEEERHVRGAAPMAGTVA